MLRAGAGVDEVEDVGRGVVAAHVAEAAAETVLLADGLVQARIDVVAVVDGGDRGLIVLLVARRIGRGVILEQAERRRVETVRGDDVVPGTGSAGQRIENRDGTLSADGLGEVSAAFQQGGHGLGAGGAVAGAAN